jgi:transposase
MNTGQTVFAQLMELLPLPEFRKCVERYRGDYKVQSFFCLDQFLCLAFAQLTYRESLRDIEACLRAQQSKLYHMGIRGYVSRNNLARANEQRDWRIYADFAHSLIRTARDLYRNEPFGLELQETIYAFDSTTIDLCLNLFPWAQFRRRKSAVKIHTLLDLRGSIPASVYVTGGQIHDVNLLDQLLMEPGAFYLLDRGYVDFRRLHLFTQAAAFFVTRAKQNIQFYRRRSHPVDRSTGVRSDQTIVLTGPKTSRLYPDPLRRIHYFDVEKDLRLIFLTNKFGFPACTIAQLYRARWRVELFFRWIKQHLRIKSFYGTSENAVKTQIWVAIAVYVLVAILKKRLQLDASLYKILQILSVTVFEKTLILQGFLNFDHQASPADPSIQLNLF